METVATSRRRWRPVLVIGGMPTNGAGVSRGASYLLGAAITELKLCAILACAHDPAELAAARRAWRSLVISSNRPWSVAICNPPLRSCCLCSATEALTVARAWASTAFARRGLASATPLSPARTSLSRVPTATLATSAGLKVGPGVSEVGRAPARSLEDSSSPPTASAGRTTWVGLERGRGQRSLPKLSLSVSCHAKAWRTSTSPWGPWSLRATPRRVLPGPGLLFFLGSHETQGER